MAETALAGVRVLDLTRVLAGPFCTMMLSDLGAEVFKVENPDGGDETRSYRPVGTDRESPYFLAINRNKRSLAIDITQPEGAIAVRALAAKCDVVVESMRTGAMERYGLGYADLAKDNPRLIYGSISGYGRTGPLADRGGYDPIAQAEVGMMAMTGDPDGPPTRMGVSLFDVMAGQYLAQAVLAALYARDRTGQGQRIDVPLYDSALSTILPYTARYLMEGTDETRIGNSSLVAQPLNVYQAADAPFVLCAAGDRLWRKLCRDGLDRADLADDPRYATNADRVANHTDLKRDMDMVFRTATLAEWLERLRRAGIPAGAIRTPGEALDSAETRDRGMVIQAPHPTEGQVPTVRSALTLTGTPVRAPVGAPLLGQHTLEVLRDVAGYAEGQVRGLANRGVVHLHGEPAPD
ncbi:MAG: CoA transferase [Alphaproteobacteria bacterium]|nr:CoA transferase [Alphaproteobacteria bacterium]MCB9930269.1 CoA transferase [Alphaproteobacteria bacterium]